MIKKVFVMAFVLFCFIGGSVFANGVDDSQVSNSTVLVDKPTMVINVSDFTDKKGFKEISESKRLQKNYADTEGLIETSLRKLGPSDYNVVYQKKFVVVEPNKKMGQINTTSPLTTKDIAQIAKDHNATYVVDVVKGIGWWKANSFIVASSMKWINKFEVNVYDAQGVLLQNYETTQSSSSSSYVLGAPGVKGPFMDSIKLCLDDIAKNVIIPPVKK